MHQVQGIGAFASKYQPQPFDGEDDRWREWVRVIRSWTSLCRNWQTSASIWRHTERIQQPVLKAAKPERLEAYRLVVQVKPSVMMWSMPAHCKGVEHQAAIKETVESLNRVGCPELVVRSDNKPAMRAFRGAVAKELGTRFGVRAIAQAPPKYDSASAGMLENASKLANEKVRTLVVAARQLPGVVVGPEEVALACRVRFSERRKAGMESLHCIMGINASVIREPFWLHCERMLFIKEATRRHRSQRNSITVSSLVSKTVPRS